MKELSYRDSGIIGSVGGGILGAAAEYAMTKNDRTISKKKKRKKILKGLIRGSFLGGGLGAGSKYAVKRYREWVGNPPVNNIDVPQFKKGDIVKANRGKYDHYGIVTDDSGNVIEYSFQQHRDPRTAKIQRTTLEKMSEGDRLEVEKPNGRFTPDQIVKRAEDRMRNQDTKGEYSLLGNNCEHFAREVANGERVSTQANTLLGKIGTIKHKIVGVMANPEQFIDDHLQGDFSPEAVAAKVVPKIERGMKSLQERFSRKHGVKTTQSSYSNLGERYYSFKLEKGYESISAPVKDFVGSNLYEFRKNLPKNLGGLTHFNKHQTEYLSGGGGFIGGLIGKKLAEKRAKREAKKLYGLKKGTAEYDNYVRSRKLEGLAKGLSLGTITGFGTSQAVDYARGRAITDKARVTRNLDFGTNYLRTGKGFRGIRSEKDIDNIEKNWKEAGDFATVMVKHL